MSDPATGRHCTRGLPRAVHLAMFLVSMGLIAGCDNANRSAQPGGASDASGASTALGNCGDEDTIASLKSAIEENALSNVITIKVLDLGNARELWLNPNNGARYCQADVALNTGQTIISYKLFFGPSGAPLIEFREGENAFFSEIPNPQEAAPTPTPTPTPGSDLPPAADSPAPAGAEDGGVANAADGEMTAPEPSGLADAAPGSDQGVYVNARFGYSIAYPRELLIPQPEADNSDGRVFAAANGEARFWVYASYVREDESAESIAALAEEECPGHRATYRVVRDSLVAVSCAGERDIIYQKTLIYGETVVTMRAKYPAAERERWDPVVETMAGSMTPAAIGD